MAVFQIYKFLIERSGQKSLKFLENGKTTFEKSQEILDEVLQPGFCLQKPMKDGTKIPLGVEFLRRADNVILMLVCNEKNLKYMEKRERQEMPVHPGCYVVVDNRPGVALVAIERNDSFDRKPDRVRDLLVEALNIKLADYELKIDIRGQMHEGSFWDVVGEMTEGYGDTISRVVFDFPNVDRVGPVDAPKPTYDKLLGLQAMGLAMNAVKGKLHLEADKNSTLLLDQTVEDCAQMVTMCCRNGYEIGVHFRKYGLYRAGKCIRALSNIEEFEIVEFENGQHTLGDTNNPEWRLIQWLDRVRTTTENYTDEKLVKKKRKRGSK